MNSCGRLRPNIFEVNYVINSGPVLGHFSFVRNDSQTRILVSKVQYSIFIKSPLCGSSDLIYKMEKKKEEGEKRLIYKSNYW